MSYDIRETIYFRESGIDNTDLTLEIAEKTAKKLGIKSVIVASTRGTTGVKACEILKGLNVIIVTHHVGFKKTGINQLTKENEEKIIKLGGRILTCIHAFSGLEKARESFSMGQISKTVERAS